MSRRSSQPVARFVGIRGTRKPKLVVERDNDDRDIKYFSVNRRLMPNGQMVLVGQFSENITSLPEDVPLDVKNLCDELLRIDGIEEVSIESYCLQIQKGAAYTWLSIDPKVCIAICQQLFGADRRKVDIDRRSNRG